MLKSRLSFEIAVLLCAKVVALSALYFVFFAPAARPHAGTQATATRLLSPDFQP